jgi:hypothetical protein
MRLGSRGWMPFRKNSCLRAGWGGGGGGGNKGGGAGVTHKAMLCGQACWRLLFL